MSQSSAQVWMSGIEFLIKPYLKSALSLDLSAVMTRRFWFANIILGLGFDPLQPKLSVPEG